MATIQNRSKAEMQEALDAAVIGLAFYDIQERETEELLAKTDDALDRFIQTERNTNVAFIRKRLGKTHIILFCKQAIPRIAKVAAVIMLVVFIGFATALATVREVRVKVLELLINIEKEYTEIYLKENDDKAFFIPADWKGEYYPSYIPDDFTLDNVVTFIPYAAEYRNEQGKIFTFTEATVDSRSTIDTEDAQIKYVFINGRQALCSIKNGKVIITWLEHSKYFVLNFSGNYTTAIKIAESIKKIN